VKIKTTLSEAERIYYEGKEKEKEGEKEEEEEKLKCWRNR
jgi:hypothetical protein